MILLLMGLAIWIGPTLKDLYQGGVFDQVGMRKYQGDTAQNLKAIRTALMLYHDSEGQFPPANSWMDAIENRMKSADLSDNDAKQKLIDPFFRNQPHHFGYAFNSSAAGKYKGDFKDPKLILVFVSSNWERNAHGSPRILLPKPSRPGGNYGITLDGTVVKL